MIYYSVVYLKDGTIHLQPNPTKEEAEDTNEKIKAKYGDRVDLVKIVKKDPASPWFKSVKGYWI